jgi:hypothetical protein
VLGRVTRSRAELTDASDFVKNMLKSFASGSLPDSIIC